MDPYDRISGERPPKGSDKFALEEVEHFEQLTNNRFRQDTQVRLKLTHWAMNVVSVYLLLVFILLVFNHNFLFLSDTVLSVLLGTTTANILGLMFIVLHGYFPSQDKFK